jgi:predicted patatin/cPLA2 family phospholipase
MRLFNRSDFTDSVRSTNILLASSAIPVVFPPIMFDNQYHVDGGIYSNELIKPGIKYCLDKGLTNITIDVIICSPPLDNITNKEIYSDTIVGIAMRTYDIMTDVVFNHELYGCYNNKKRDYANTFPIYIYKPENQYKGGILNFDHEDLVDSFLEGYNMTMPSPLKYCYN